MQLAEKLLTVTSTTLQVVACAGNAGVAAQDGRYVTKLCIGLVGIALATGIGIRILAPLVALSLPLQIAARLALRRELRRLGIRRYIPRACVTEMADAAAKSNASFAETMNWSILLIKDRISTESARNAKAIREWLYGASTARLPEYLVAVLLKHRIHCGLLADSLRAVDR